MSSYCAEAPLRASYRGKPLYYKGRDGSLRVWEIWTEENQVVTNYGIVGGKMQRSRRACSSKGKGKAQTTPEEQAIKEAKAKHKHNLDRKYSDDPQAASLPLELPMLADTFYKKDYSVTPKGKRLLAQPFDVQPKIDGARALARWDGNKVILISRNGKLWKGMEHITSALERMLPKDWEADGEMYIHGVPLQTIMSWLPKENAKKFKPERLRLEFWIFDVPVIDGEDTLTWYNRRAYMKPREGPSPFEGHPQIKVVPYKDCPDLEGVYAAEERIVGKGFEGVMLRSHEGLYEYGRRSPTLLKAKRFQDEEFEIVGFEDGVGKFKGAVVFVCKKDDKVFKVVPRGSMEARRVMFKSGSEYVGKRLTVRFQKETEDGLPFLPVGIPNAAFVRHAFDQPDAG